MYSTERNKYISLFVLLNKISEALYIQITSIHEIYVFTNIPVFVPPRGVWLSVSCECVGCQVEVSAQGRSPVQSSPADCRYVTDCYPETSALRRPWPSLGCCAQGKRKIKFIYVQSFIFEKCQNHYAPC
jgi:hypothetical protein